MSLSKNRIGCQYYIGLVNSMLYIMISSVDDLYVCKSTWLSAYAAACQLYTLTMSCTIGQTIITIFKHNHNK